jgi:hypothetical protein
MSTQTTLAFPPPLPARTTDPQTSHDAARKAIGNSALRGPVFEAHCANPDGLTDDELRHKLTDVGVLFNHGSVSKRRRDLCDDNLLVDSGKTRLSDSGSAQTVWCRP